MFCHSLRHEGEELLGGVEGYPDFPWTSGIPLLYPWANRLAEFGYDGVALDPDSPDLYVMNGLPLHGLRSAVTGWEVVESGATRLVAGRELDVPEFPFPHRVEVDAELSKRALTLTTTVTAHEVPVPIAFGYHPYFKLERDWEIRLPVAERIVVDERQIPTGEREPAGNLDGPLGSRTFDDGFTVAPDGGPFVLEGGGRRIEVAFEHGYPCAQIFAPAVSDVICFEPMTAAADALRRSPRTVAPGASFSARFSVAVSRAHAHRQQSGRT
ncbi:MAG TPA: aldose 1-epimerase [Solirubrobacter sp.]|nr:aldose 1-epimerase [Solirubrobacter sp.]